jgi:SAM-dependent methyltransferase
VTNKFSPKNYWENRLEVNFNLKGVGDIGLSESYNEFLYRVRASAFRQTIKDVPLDNASTNVLDVGSGTGFYVNQWIKVGIENLIGSDLTDTAVSKLKSKYPYLEFYQLDIGIPLTDKLKVKKFDVITAFDMLFHIVDDDCYEQAFRNFAKIIKPGGYLIFSDNLMQPDQGIHLEHQVSRSEEDVFELMRENGFSLNKTIPMFVLMNDPVRSGNRIMKKLFSYIYAFASKGELNGKLLGGLLYPIEILLLKLFKRGPSTEIFVWQRTVNVGLDTE